MVLKVAVSREEFEGAQAGGDVYGKYASRANMWVYIELGEEGTYRSTKQDDPRTQYRIFFNCDAYWASSIEMLETGDDFGRMSGVTVIIYC